MDYKKLLEILRGHRIWIQTHNFPDPDAIASAYGLQYFLDYFGIPSKICYNGNVDKISVSKMISTFQIEMSPIDEVQIRTDDYVVLVDGQKYNANLTDIPGIEVAVIDHHKTVKSCEYLYKDVRICGSCATLIAQYIRDAKVPMTKKVASVLSYGLKMDTDSMNRGVTKLDIEMLDYLFDYMDRDLVQSLYNNEMELKDLRAYGAAIESIQIYDYIGLARIPFDCQDALIAMVSDFILRLDAVTIAVIYAERNGGLKFSVRSEEAGIHAGDLTMKALSGIGDGGGHFTMAGGFMPKASRLGEPSIEDRALYERFLDAVRELKREVKEEKKGQ